MVSLQFGLVSGRVNMHAFGFTGRVKFILYDCRPDVRQQVVFIFKLSRFNHEEN